MEKTCECGVRMSTIVWINMLEFFYLYTVFPDSEVVIDCLNCLAHIRFFILFFTTPKTLLSMAY